MASVRTKARLAGLFYLLTFPTAYAFLVRGKLVLPNDPAGTVSGILAHERLLRMASAADVLGVAAYLVVTALLYELLAPVSRSLSRVAAFFSLTGCIVQVFATAFDRTTLSVLALPALAPERDALVFTLMRAHVHAFNVGILFFGLYCLLIGILIVRSTFLPRVIGVLMMLAGIAYVTNDLAVLLQLPLARALGAATPVLAGLGEGSLMLWLLIVGLNPERWAAQARAPAERAA
jgi:hypothetical protein